VRSTSLGRIGKADERGLAAGHLSEFRDARIHQRILSLSEGVLGRICKLMEAAAIEAIHSGEERISLSLLKDDLVTESLVSIADRRTRRFSG
jgi:hypothetical protein